MKETVTRKKKTECHAALLEHNKVAKAHTQHKTNRLTITTTAKRLEKTSKASLQKQQCEVKRYFLFAEDTLELAKQARFSRHLFGFFFFSSNWHREQKKPAQQVLLEPLCCTNTQTHRKGKKKTTQRRTRKWLELLRQITADGAVEEERSWCKYKKRNKTKTACKRNKREKKRLKNDCRLQKKKRQQKQEKKKNGLTREEGGHRAKRRKL